MNKVLAQDITSIEDLTLGDEYLFEEVLLRNEDITKQLLERFTGIDGISDIKYISTEDVQQATKKSKGVRFDVYVKDQDGVAYIVELQRTDTAELPKRARYYQTTSDSRQLPKGAKYRDLKDNYVIFICREDIFGHGLYKYTFENMCHEIKDLTLNDGTYKIFLNTQGKNVNACDDVVDFLKFIEGIASDNPFIKKIEAAAEEIKADEIWRGKRMQSLVREQYRHDEAIAKGRAEERVEIARNLLNLNLPIEQVVTATNLTFEAVEALQSESS